MWPDNLWIGVTVENFRVIERIDDLRSTGAKVRFLSCEPLLSPLYQLNLKGIAWVIVGGESGRTPRPVQYDWIADIRDQCQAADVPFYFKQWGGTNKKKSGRLLDGRVYDGMPAKLKERRAK